MSSQNDDISSNVLRQMKAGGFDFTQIHPIEFYAVFPDEAGARRAAGQFRGESLNAQVKEAGRRCLAPGTEQGHVCHLWRDWRL